MWNMDWGNEVLGSIAGPERGKLWRCKSLYFLPSAWLVILRRECG
jgi:hypothetical protein